MNTLKSTLLILTLSIVSCTKQFEAETDMTEPITGDKISFSITASIEDIATSKATSDPVIRVTWQAGDQISVLDLTHGVNLGKLTAGSTGSDVNFSGDISKPDNASYIGYVYPAISVAPTGTVSTGVTFETQAINDRTVFCASAVDSDPEAYLGNRKIKFSIANAFIDVGMTNLPKSTPLGKIIINDVSNAMSWVFTKTGISATSSEEKGITLSPASGDTPQTSDKGYFMFGFACPPSSETTSRRLIKIYDNSSALISHADIFKRAISGNEFIETVSAGHGLFSVGVNKYVNFAPGNLQATVDENGAATEWSFASPQYTSIGDTPANKNAIGGLIDLFAWSTDGLGATAGYKTLGINTSPTGSDYYGFFVDWGSAISSLGTDWRTPTKDEWQCLIDNKTSGRKRKSNVIVNNVKCFILAPDGYTGEIADSYEASAWLVAEKEGFVCLPFTGYRNNIAESESKSESGLSINALTTYGCYWSSSTANESQASSLRFQDGGFQLGDATRKKGYAVRLIRDY